ncbi:hypothetical protein M3Y96_00697300 [Aphelenchoides besseyi]|nr:hypothetical protein M3Y96_00697300 [Aphelenchoides besseyi]
MYKVPDTSNDDLAQFVLNKMFQNYNKDIAPSKRGATQVTIEFIVINNCIIQAIGHISEISSSFTLDLSTRFCCPEFIRVFLGSVLADMARRTVEV